MIKSPGNHDDYYKPSIYSKLPSHNKAFGNVRNFSNLDKFIQFSDQNANGQFDTSNKKYGKDLMDPEKEDELKEFKIKLNLNGYGDINSHGLRHGPGYSNMKHKITYVL